MFDDFASSFSLSCTRHTMGPLPECEHVGRELRPCVTDHMISNARLAQRMSGTEGPSGGTLSSGAQSGG